MADTSLAKKYLAQWEAGISWHIGPPLSLQRLMLISTNCHSEQLAPPIYRPARDGSEKLSCLLSLGRPCCNLLLCTLLCIKSYAWMMDPRAAPAGIISGTCVYDRLPGTPENYSVFLTGGLACLPPPRKALQRPAEMLCQAMVSLEQGPGNHRGLMLMLCNTHVNTVSLPGGSS